MTGPMSRMTFEVQGLAGLEQAFEAKLREQLPAGDTVFEVKAGGARGGATNAMITKVLASMGRNFAWVNPKTGGQIAFAARDLFGKAAAVKRRAEETIKSLLLIGIGENVQAQKNPGGGSFRGLTANYAAQKQRIHGFKVPIGKATGDLLGGLHVEVKRT